MQTSIHSFGNETVHWTDDSILSVEISVLNNLVPSSHLDNYCARIKKNAHTSTFFKISIFWDGNRSFNYYYWVDKMHKGWTNCMQFQHFIFMWYFIKYYHCCWIKCWWFLIVCWCCCCWFKGTSTSCVLWWRSMYSTLFTTFLFYFSNHDLIHHICHYVF